MLMRYITKKRIIFCLLLIIFFSNDAVASSKIKILLINLNLEEHSNSRFLKLKDTLTELDKNLEIVLFHYHRVSKSTILEIKPDAVILSPQGTPWWNYPKEQLSEIMSVVRELELPTLGICGGHQLLAMSYGGEVAPIQGMKKGKSYSGFPAEKGFNKIKLIKESKLLKKISPKSYFYESHHEEVKKIPNEFKIIACCGQKSLIQVIEHESKPIYGVQFHPEVFTEQYPQGEQVLKNFIEIIKEYSNRKTANMQNVPKVLTSVPKVLSKFSQYHCA